MKKILEKKLEKYFKEANSHIEILKISKNRLKEYYPIDEITIQNIDIKLLIDVLIFRFSKLQDLLGAKIFKTILEYEGINTNTKFYDLLSELEKMNVLTPIEWIELREIRNSIAHEYAIDEENELIENINKIYLLTEKLIKISKTLELEYRTLKDKFETN